MRGRGDKQQSARVHDEPPVGETFVPPERDVRSGRPTVGDRSNKHRSTEQPAADVPVGTPPRRLPRRIPRWVPATVAAAVVAAGIAGIALIAGGGDDNQNDSAAANTGAAAGAPVAAVTTTATPDTTAPTATTISAPVATTQPPTTAATTTTTTTTLPPTTTTTIPAGLNPKRITGYEITRTMTQAYDADGPTPNLLDPEPQRFSTFCDKGRCVYPWIEEIPFDAAKKRLTGIQQFEFGCGIVRTESVTLQRTRNGTYKGFERSATAPMRTAQCDTIAYEYRITMKPVIG
jgi:hypothetical protein